jgi:glutamate synthase domain-containing protein 2/glutamate synthase domain-containing protein 1/glutamate synthase domain-containing protein 3
MPMKGLPPSQGLYDPSYEHDACGVGFICHIKGKPSHQIVTDALQMLENMNHRGGCGCEENSGDGAGIMVRLPDAFLREKCAALGINLPKLGTYAVGQVFLSREMVARHEAERIFEKVVREYGMVVLGWRDVPVNEQFVGPTPKTVQPKIRQVFLGMGDTFYNRTDFDRRLYLVRQGAENVIEFGAEVSAGAREDFYICSLSTNRIVYKGMLTADQLRHYYVDLEDPKFVSALAIVHSRFSTNTFPAWRLAHPYRIIAHNGEINTLRGNRNWMRARSGKLKSEIFGDELEKMFPLLTETGSDSATLDNALQFLVVNGRALPHAVMMLIPEAWQKHELMNEDLKAFYEYHACLMEPWDGPASIAFTNGQMIGAVLDRNGLRPSRYYVTRDDLVIMASEVGTIPVDPANVAHKWRLQPGKIFLVDMNEGRIVDDGEIKEGLVEKRPWKRWVDENMVNLDDLPSPTNVVQPNHDTLLVRQQAFGYTNEDIKIILSPMARGGLEGLGSMGTDTPLACLSEKPQLLYAYFKQLFAQVTNPPLDANFEELVTSLITYLGCEGNLLEESPTAAHLIKLQQPILSNTDLAKLREVGVGDLRSVTLHMLFNVAEGEAGLEKALTELCEAAAKAVVEGAPVLILSDRGVDKDKAPIPSLLATAAVHHHLIRQGTRTQCGLVIETGEAREIHHFCLLIGYGAGAVNPYLAFETIADMHQEQVLPANLTLDAAKKHYIKAANKGIIKVASKMGISTVQSYRGAQIFEAVGLSKGLVAKYFTGTASRLDGIPLEVIAAESLARHRHAFPPIKIEPDARVLDNGGQYQWRRDGEYHMWNPDTVAKLQQAVRITGYPTFKEYTKLVNDESKHRCTIRGLLNFKKATPVPLSEVEPVTEIVKRFVTGAMSFGSISKEAHENLAIAMNRIGGKSNTGEGGEDSNRFKPDSNGDLRRSAIKQVASARFGVTTEYLVNADELQIKMAQGAKPGEGGQLPGHKVDDYIGKVRHSTPGVGLISPPPHHDIYSIEDLAQLIHDLKNANPQARVSVKLVSEVGVGTVAAGVAKAKADHILIAGDSGGTGASPLTSIKYAGMPWEIGVAETQQTLVLNGLRGRIILQTDGQIKTGRDVVVGALLGAEEFGFSTGPLIASGCIMMRVCHLNTCPVGIATQDPVLRKKFAGKPEHVINFMFFIAEEVRELMAEMGFRTFNEMIGQTQMLEFQDLSSHWKARFLDLSAVLHKPRQQIGSYNLYNVQGQDHGLQFSLDQLELIRLAAPALERGEKVRHELPIKNTNRTVGTTLSGEVAKKYGFAGLPEDTITFKFNGSAGQSFGAFLARGITLLLEGDANDYVGKGLSGGRIAVYPDKQAIDSGFVPEENIIAGNTLAYGAISGEMYFRGVVGERFCVRNSGASAVVEGCGDHGCEYMTGGRVVVIGPTGRNFAAGMSGGIAYVFAPPDDRREPFHRLCNQNIVTLEKPDAFTDDDRRTLRQLLETHASLTGSPIARKIVDDWDEKLKYFVKVMPNDYRRVLKQKAAEIEKRIAEEAKTQPAGNADAELAAGLVRHGAEKAGE